MRRPPPPHADRLGASRFCPTSAGESRERLRHEQWSRIHEQPYQRPWVEWRKTNRGLPLGPLSACLRPLCCTSFLLVVLLSGEGFREVLHALPLGDMHSHSGPQVFWHQGLVSCKTVFPQTVGGRGWDGFGMIQANYIYCALYYYYYISFISGHQPLDPRGWWPPLAFLWKWWVHIITVHFLKSETPVSFTF